ncbi:hypothetical protein AB0M28_13580 [Streptomyces sp. NPDC051940]|uniref:hypothetical protein n=1 Tax=Streptomyces sp. NPDC051940 TaxID=3155675 RepID=UPI0034177A32
MDPALSGLIGALGGAAVVSIGTIATTWITSRATAQQQAGQLRQQAEQLQQQHRFEHLRERRDPRSSAYSAFLAKGRELRDTVSRDTQTAADSSQMRSHSDDVDELRRLAATVSIEGPDEITQPVANVQMAASRVWLTAYQIAIARERGDTERRDAMLRDYIAAERELDRMLDAFLNCARKILDEFGHDST